MGIATATIVIYIRRGYKYFSTGWSKSCWANLFVFIINGFGLVRWAKAIRSIIPSLGDSSAIIIIESGSKDYY